MADKLYNADFSGKTADTVFKNARVVNVFTEEIITADVAVKDGIIIGVGEYCGVDAIDLTGKYLCPGLIDAHLHIESSLVTPEQFIKTAVKFGTLTFIADPHEAANVSGNDGIDYMLDATENVSANVFFMVPSCVPCTRFEDNGCTLEADNLKKYLTHNRVLGLGEVMDLGAVLSCDEGMKKKLSLFREKHIDGHAPGAALNELCRYRLAGITSDHESDSYEKAKAEVRLGFSVLIREGSAAKNLDEIVKGIVKNRDDITPYCFCTDDKHIDDILKDGHINYCVKRAISLGLSPVKAIKMATINPARHYGLSNLGAIAPSYQADFLVLNDLESMSPEAIYHKGKLVDNEKPLPVKIPENLKNTIHINKLDSGFLKLLLTEKVSPVIYVEKSSIGTKLRYEELPQKDGVFIANNIYNKIAVVERHKKTGKIGIGAAGGFCIKNGAVASSVAHDSHNIIVIGDNDRDMELAVKTLVENGGGYVVTKNGKVKGDLPLPVMGLMTDDSFENANTALIKMIKDVHDMGVDSQIDPFFTLSFLALPVIPEVRITARGLYNILDGRFIKY